MRFVFDRQTQSIVSAEDYYARKHERVAASDLPFPRVISDQIELKSMADGQMYTSKSGLRRSYRQLGYVEVGNEELKPTPKPNPDRKAIRESVGKAFARAGLST
jgi:hypothetical protein